MTASALLAITVVGGCGDDDQQGAVTTIVETAQVPAPTSVPAPSTPAPPTEAAPTTVPAQPSSPAGATLVEGTFPMVERRSDFDGENTVVDDAFEGDWIFTTTCPETECAVSLRRELRNGGLNERTRSCATTPSTAPSPSAAPW